MKDFEDIERKHKRLVSNYSQEKSKHLEKQANKMLKNDENNQKLKSYKIKGSFLDLF
jgi:threonine dehydratase